MGVYLKRGQLRRKSRCPGQGAGGGGFSLQEVKGGGGGGVSEELRGVGLGIPDPGSCRAERAGPC